MLEFVKYQGTGNDFIILDGRKQVPQNLDVALLCHRKFGIGADGLMILQNHPKHDFEMIYYNSDGNLSTMCGNGGRCLAHYAHALGLGSNNSVIFHAVDGEHRAEINGDWVSLGMIDTSLGEKRDNVYILNTGSPHYVYFTENAVSEIDLVPFARNIRYGSEFQAEGINVNVVQVLGNHHLDMRTYERGVEDETLSCGTGVTAAALAYLLSTQELGGSVKVTTPGGELEVTAAFADGHFSSVVLKGPVERVFTGKY